MYQLLPIASHPIATHLWEEFGSIVAVSSDQVAVESHISPSLPSIVISASSLRSHSPAPPNHLDGLRWAHPWMSTPFFWWDAQIWRHLSRCSFISVHQRGHIPRLDVLAVLWLIQPRLPFLTARSHGCSVLHSLVSSNSADLPLASRDPKKSVGDSTFSTVGSAAEAEHKDLGIDSKKWLRTSWRWLSCYQGSSR